MPVHKPDATTVSSFCRELSNWGRWGPDDQLGTLNFITDELILRASRLVRRGRVFSLAIPLDETGPWNGPNRSGRFNPIHLMIRDGNDALAGTMVRDFYGGKDGQLRGTDDVVIMPLQCGTQWDALAHAVHEGKIYNGFDASYVSSKGALRNAVAVMRDKVVSRGVLLDIARYKKHDWLEPGEVVTDVDLEECMVGEGLSVSTGDVVLIRTGQMAQVKAAGQWGGYATGGPAPGLGISTARWFSTKQVAAAAIDNSYFDVVPNETDDVSSPLHVICIVYMGLLVGEIFDLEELARDCAEDGVYEFFFVCQPLPFTRAVGSPINPIAIK